MKLDRGLERIHSFLNVEICKKVGEAGITKQAESMNFGRLFLNQVGSRTADLV